MTLEDLLSTTVPCKDKDGNDIEISPDFRVAIQGRPYDGGIHFIIHPFGHSGETLDFVVTGNTLRGPR